MKRLTEFIKTSYLWAIVFLVAGLFLGWLFFHPSDNKRETVTELSEAHDHEHEEGLWTCSMHPQIRSDKPGKCPICGMDLVPVTSVQQEESITNPAEIVMSESAAALANIQTYLVSGGVAPRKVFLQGKVKADERRISELTARFGGRIEKLYISFTGENVSKGDRLASIYSPQLVTAQRELIEASLSKEIRPELYRAALSKLKLWDLTDEQIEGIESKGEPLLYFDILSPITGTVTKRNVALGDYVKEGSALFEVTDLSRVWVMFDAYESDLPWVKTGNRVDFTLMSLPGKELSATVSYIDPFIDPVTRVARVRVEVPNTGLALKPEMFASGRVNSVLRNNEDKVMVPKSSVLWTGKRAVVYVKVPDREQPTFLYRDIVLGPVSGEFYVVEEGLTNGEEIAVNGVFKIDAAAQLAGKPSMMNPTGGKVSTGHNHGGMKMSDEEMAAMDNTQADLTVDQGAVPDKFRTQLGRVATSYLTLKDAFVESDEKKASDEAGRVLATLGKVDMTILSGDAHNKWMTLLGPIKDNLNGIANMKGIEMKRSHFSIVSDKLAEAIRLFGAQDAGKGDLYWEFCPMAFDNKGAYWISDSKEIRNPYFGDAMLTCGEVKETLTSNK